MRKTPLLQVLAISLLTLLLSGCFPKGAEYIDEMDMVITLVDRNADFNNYTVYTYADSVYFVTSDKDAEYPADAAEKIKRIVKETFDSYGWEELAIEDTVGGVRPDVYIVPTIMDINNTGYVYYPPYYPGYPGWGYPGYPYYPWYPGYGYTYSYRTGTVIIEMGDVINAEIDHEKELVYFPILWSGAVNGLLQGSSSSIESRFRKGMNTMFEKSPYLKK